MGFEHIRLAGWAGHLLLQRTRRLLLVDDTHLVDSRYGETDRQAGHDIVGRRGRGDVERTRQARQVVRTAGLGSGAGEALAAKGLRADDGADLVAVDIDVAGLDAVAHMLDARVDARVEAE